MWTPDSKALFYTAADRKLYAYSVADGKTAVVASSDLGRIGSVAISPDSKWVMFSKQDRTLRSHVYIAPLAGGEERHVSEDRVHYSENNAVFTADGRYIAFTSTESTPTGIASQGGINSVTTLWATALRDQERDPTNRDIDTEAQGLAAEAAARPGGGRGGAAGTTPPAEVRIDWTGIARRARQLSVPGNVAGGLTPAPEGHSVALSIASAAAGGRGGGAAADPTAGMYVINVESSQLTRVPQPAPQAAGDGGGRGARTWRCRRRVWRRLDGFRARRPHVRTSAPGTGLYAAPLGNPAAPARPQAAAAAAAAVEAAAPPRRPPRRQPRTRLRVR